MIIKIKPYGWLVLIITRYKGFLNNKTQMDFFPGKKNV